MRAFRFSFAPRSTLLILVASIAAANAFVWEQQLGGEESAKTGERLPVAADPRDANRSAIGTTMASLAQAFSAGDAKALALLWTAEGEYQNDAGVSLRGRAGLESSFASYFAKAPEPKAEVLTESVRFLSGDTAIAEGTVVVRRGPAEPTKRAAYSALLVREGGRWRIAQLKESAREGASIEDLSWLIGQWKSLDNQGAEIRTTYAWAPNKKFIHVTFTLKEKATALSGHQIIGMDPATGSLRSWTFEANGGVGEADWERDGDHWILHAVGTLADARTLTQINVLRRINNDTLTWQSVHRKLEGTEVPDLPPVKVTRDKPETLR